MDAPILFRQFSRLRQFSRAAGFKACKDDSLKDTFIRRHASVASKAQASKVTRIFRTDEEDPTKHNLDHVGLFYKVHPNELNSLFRNCIHPYYLRLMKSFNEACIMVRKPSLELNGYLSNINLDHPVQKFVLYGTRGAGKGMTLLHTLQYCARNDWIIVHVPWAGRWVRGFYKEVAESSFKPGRFDLPADGAEWLSHFRAQNPGKLKDMKTTTDYVWTKREKSVAGTPLDEIIDFGLNRLKFSSDCVGVILKELRQQAQKSGLKVLVAVNAVNAFFVPWSQTNALKSSEKKIIPPSEISLIHNFKKMMSPTWNHGAVVCTVEEEANDVGFRDGYTPKYLLHQEGFEWLDPFVPILVPEYTEKEASNCIEYYIDRKWILNERGRTEDGIKEILFVSNKNPFSLYKVCSSL